jgi:predicted Na+-dependent transporter
MNFLAKFATQAMAGGVFLGLIFPVLADVFRPMLAPAVWGLLFLAMLRIDLTDLKERLRRPVFVIGLLVWMLVVMPVLMAITLSFVDIRPGLEAAMVLAAGSSSLFSTPALGLMFGLDTTLLLIILVASTLIIPITVPLVGLLLLGFDMGADPLVLMARMGGLVMSAVVCVIIVRWLLGQKRLERNKTPIEGLSVILLIIFAFAIMEGVTARIIEDPLDIAYVAGLSFATYIGMMVVGAAFFYWIVPGVGKRGALSAGFVLGTRNLAIILAVLPASLDGDIPLFFAIGQFPIYIMPMLLKPVFRRLLIER